jgi:membrane-associated phospholipid phosphatase
MLSTPSTPSTTPSTPSCFTKLQAIRARFAQYQIGMPLVSIIAWAITQKICDSTEPAPPSEVLVYSAEKTGHFPYWMVVLAGVLLVSCQLSLILAAYCYKKCKNSSKPQLLTALPPQVPTALPPPPPSPASALSTAVSTSGSEEVIMDGMDSQPSTALEAPTTTDSTPSAPSVSVAAPVAPVPSALVPSTSALVPSTPTMASILQVARWNRVALIITCCFVTVMITEALKVVCGGVRPSYNLHPEERDNRMGFPSGHTSTSAVIGFLFFVVVYAETRPYTESHPSLVKWARFLSLAFTWGFPFGVAVSRVVHFYHTFIQVLAGYVLGNVVPLLISFIFIDCIYVPILEVINDTKDIETPPTALEVIVTPPTH